MPIVHKTGKKNRKHGRNKLGCETYAREGRQEKNKAKRLMRHIKRVPWDLVARSVYEALPVLARKGNGELPPAAIKPETGIWRKVPKAALLEAGNA